MDEMSLFDVVGGFGEALCELNGPANDDRIDRERQIDRATLPSWTVPSD